MVFVYVHVYIYKYMYVALKKVSFSLIEMKQTVPFRSIPFRSIPLYIYMYIYVRSLIPRLYYMHGGGRGPGNGANIYIRACMPDPARTVMPYSERRATHMECYLAH